MIHDKNKKIDSFFAKKENLITTSLLEELVRDQFNQLLLKEETGVQIPKNFGIKYSSIPEVSVSELGWSSLVEKQEGGSTIKISSEQRAQLEQYLKNIQGAGLAEKFKNISQFYEGNIAVLTEKGILDKNSRSTRIQQIMSYLVFIKTLTTIITNFNAASAGFAFESFLGVLLGGEQVKTGSGTIADLTTKDGIGISLKLYSDKKVHVGGSFSDLVGDMINPKNPSKPFIRYVVAVKSLSGKGLELTGTIDVHQFDVSLDNIDMLMSRGGKSSKMCIRLPVSFIKDGTDYSHLKKTFKPQEEVEEWFDEQVRNSDYAEDSQFEDWYNLLKRAELSDPKFFENGKPEKLGVLGRSNIKKTYIDDLFKSFAQQGLLDNPDMATSTRRVFKSDISGQSSPWPSYSNFFKDLYEKAKDFAIVKGDVTPASLEEARIRNRFTNANLQNLELELLEEAARKTATKKPAAKKKPAKKEAPKKTPAKKAPAKKSRAKTKPEPEEEYEEEEESATQEKTAEELMPGILFATTEESLAYFRGVKDPEQKKKALKNTYGYLDIMQFGFTKPEVLDIIAASKQEEKIATLEVGRNRVEQLLNKLKDAINVEIYEIFDSLNVLTTNINSYFANGLNEDSAAFTAQAAAKNIDAKTALVQQQVKSNK